MKPVYLSQPQAFTGAGDSNSSGGSGMTLPVLGILGGVGLTAAKGGLYEPNLGKATYDSFTKAAKDANLTGADVNTVSNYLKNPSTPTSSTVTSTGAGEMSEEVFNKRFKKEFENLGFRSDKTKDIRVNSLGGIDSNKKALERINDDIKGITLDLEHSKVTLDANQEIHSYIFDKYGAMQDITNKKPDSNYKDFDTRKKELQAEIAKETDQAKKDTLNKKLKEEFTDIEARKGELPTKISEAEAKLEKLKKMDAPADQLSDQVRRIKELKEESYGLDYKTAVGPTGQDKQSHINEIKGRQDQVAEEISELEAKLKEARDKQGKITDHELSDYKNLEKEIKELEFKKELKETTKTHLENLATDFGDNSKIETKLESLGSTIKDNKATHEGHGIKLREKGIEQGIVETKISLINGAGSEKVVTREAAEKVLKETMQSKVKSTVAKAGEAVKGAIPENVAKAFKNISDKLPKEFTKNIREIKWGEIAKKGLIGLGIGIVAKLGYDAITRKQQPAA